MFRLNRLIQKHQQADAVGVHFDELAVRVVALNAYQGHYHLLALAQHSLPEGAVEQGRIVDATAVAQSLSQALISAQISPKQAVSCVTSEAVMTRVIELDGGLDDEAVEAQILLDAERYIAEPLDEVGFDFVVLDRTADATKVLLIVAYQSAISDCVDALALADVETLAVDTQDNALLRAYRLLGREGYMLLMDFQQSQAKAHIAHAGEFVQSQTQLFGLADFQSESAEVAFTPKADVSSDTTADFYQFFANHTSSFEQTATDDLRQDLVQDVPTDALTNSPISLQTDLPRQDGLVATLKMPSERIELADAFDFSVDETRNSVVIQTADAQNSDVSSEYQICFNETPVSPAVLTPSDAPILVDAQSSFDSQSHQSVFNYQSVVNAIAQLVTMQQTSWQMRFEGVLLTGLGEHSAPLAQALTDELNIPAMTLNVFEHIENSSQMRDIQLMALAGDFAVACGLALQPLNDGAPKINLLPWRDEMRFENNQRFKKLLIAVVGLACVVVLLGYAWIWQNSQHQQAVNDELTQRIEIQENKARQMTQIHREIDEIKAKLGAFHTLESDSRVLLDKWQNFGALLPEGVYLQTMTKAGDTLNLSGIAVDSARISAFANALEMSGYYEEVLTTGLQKSTNYRDLYEFQMTANIRKQPTNDEATSQAGER